MHLCQPGAPVFHQPGRAGHAPCHVPLLNSFLRRTGLLPTLPSLRTTPQGDALRVGARWAHFLPLLGPTHSARYSWQRFIGDISARPSSPGGDSSHPRRHVLYVLEIEVGGGGETPGTFGGTEKACGGLMGNWTVFLRNGSTDSEVFRQVRDRWM